MTTVFGSVADRYQDFRPGYPDWITTEILRYHGRQPGLVAEIGAGTGLGTRVLAALGAPVICVEPDERMAAYLPLSVSTFTGTFEQWEPPPAGVDVLACAMAWHWTDAQTRYQRAVAALAPGGTLALFTHRYAYVDPAHLRAIDETFQAFDGDAQDVSLFWLYDEVADSGLFQRPECHVVSRDLPLTTVQYVSMISTSSLYLNRPAAEQDALAAALTSTIDSFGGTVTLDLRTILVLASARHS